MTVKTESLADTAPARLATSFGHPRGLAFLAGTEAWERFSFASMQTLLVLYMVQHLLVRDTGHVLGLQPLRAGFEGLYGPLAPQGFASALFGLYVGLVYLTPILGGFVADRFLGKRRTVMLGAVLLACGHIAMAFETTFLPALTLLVLGCGCFKSNIAGQVGELYAPDDARRASAYQLFFVAVQVGAVLAPIVAGTLGQRLGWSYGFGAAGLGMLVAIAIYVAGWRYLPAEAAPRTTARSARAALTGRDRVAVALLLFLLPVLALAAAPNLQVYNAYLVWAEARADIQFAGQALPSTWLIAIDTAAGIAMGAGLVALWRALQVRSAEPDELVKAAAGAALAACGFLLLAVLAAGDGRVALAWLVLFHLINAVAFATLFPAMLSLYARAAPASLTSTMIGLHFLYMFLGGNLAGATGARFETMPADRFWIWQGAMAGAAATILALTRIFAGRLLLGRRSDT